MHDILQDASNSREYVIVADHRDKDEDSPRGLETPMGLKRGCNIAKGKNYWDWKDKKNERRK